MREAIRFINSVVRGLGIAAGDRLAGFAWLPLSFRHGSVGLATMKG
jgi:hypothetical protein